MSKLKVEGINDNNYSSLSSYSLEGGYSSSAFDRYVQEHGDSQKSVKSRVQQQYWVTKQAVIKKFGRKEDEYVVAGDQELDAKLEVSTGTVFERLVIN